MANEIIANGFQGVQFETTIRNNEPWLRANQIGLALQYGQRGDQIDPPFAERSIRTLYTRHADEFTDSMTAIVILPTPGGPQETRIFSLRGCHLLAMFARTDRAKAFRRWVLDVLETLNKAKPTPKPKKKLPALPLHGLPRVEQAALPSAPSSGHAAAMAIKTLNPAPGNSGEYYEAELLRVFRDFAAWRSGVLARMEELERDYSRVTGLLYRDALYKLMRDTPLYMTDMGVWAMGESYQDAVKAVREGVAKWECLFSKAQWFAKTLRVNW